MKKLIFVLLALCLIGTACEDKELPTNPAYTTSLVNTKWKLVCIVDAETNVLTEFEPKDCVECYTLTFDTDSTFSGQSATNFLIGALSIYNIDYKTGKLNFTNIGGTEIGEIGHGYIYVETLWKVNSFTVKGSYPRELHFWYNDGKNYLKYKETGGSNEN